MKCPKILTIVGTRPEIIRLSMLIPKLDENFDHVFVHTGQNTDPKLNDVFFRDLGLRRPDYFLNVNTQTLGSVIGDTFIKCEEVFQRESPSAIVILGDTNSALVAILSERMGIPVYHLEAGNRSFDNNVPEEMNRKIVDRVASFNLPYNDFSMRNLLEEGIHPRQVMKSGSPIGEIYANYREQISASRVLEAFGLTGQGYFLASIHRQENVDNPERLGEVLGALQELADHFDLPVLVTTHPRTRKRLVNLDMTRYSGLRFEEPFGFLDYNKLQLSAKCVISDSGTIFEESAIMNFKAVCLRDSMERPEAFEKGMAFMSTVQTGEITRVVQLALNSDAPQTLPQGYEVEDFSERVLRFISSTIGVRNIWMGIR